MVRLITTSCFSWRSFSLMPRMQRTSRSQIRMRSIRSPWLLTELSVAETGKNHGRPLTDEAAQSLGRQRLSPADQLARRLDVVPHVAHHHAPDLALAQVVDDAGAVFFMPVGKSLQPRIDLAGRLVAELEQVRKEIRLIGVGLTCAGHVPPRPLSLGEGLIPVLDAHRLPQHPVRKKGIVSRSEERRVGKECRSR